MELIYEELGVELWRHPHPSGDAEVFYVKDPTRSPEDQTTSDFHDAVRIFREQVAEAASNTPRRPA